MTTLQIDHIGIAYGDRPLLTDFCLSLGRGETACLTGPSGCGKTSVLNAVMGFVPLTEGRIHVEGVELGRSTVDEVRRRMAWIPQELSLPVEWVSDMVAMPFGLKANRSAAFSETELLTRFDRLGLERGRMLKRTREISAGQRQRVMLAVASLLRKPLIVADEPTSALDPEARDRVADFLLTEAEGGAAILSVSHDGGFASRFHHVVTLP